MRLTDLTLAAGSVQFIENGAVPRDANVIRTTWRFVNKSGGPDRRFNNNYQLPVVLYGTLDVSAPSGMQLSLQTSADSLAAASAELLLVVQTAVRDLEARRAGEPWLESLPDFADDPPPLFVIGSRIFHALRDVVSFGWLDRLPEWATLPFWGILFALPPVAAIIRFAEGGTFANIFLFASLVAAGGDGTPRLQIPSPSTGKSNRGAAATKSRFRARPRSRIHPCRAPARRARRPRQPTRGLRKRVGRPDRTAWPHNLLKKHRTRRPSGSRPSLRAVCQTPRALEPLKKPSTEMRRPVASRSLVEAPALLVWTGRDGHGGALCSP